METLSATQLVSAPSAWDPNTKLLWTDPLSMLVVHGQVMTCGEKNCFNHSEFGGKASTHTTHRNTHTETRRNTWKNTQTTHTQHTHTWRQETTRYFNTKTPSNEEMALAVAVAAAHVWM